MKSPQQVALQAAAYISSITKPKATQRYTAAAEDDAAAAAAQAGSSHQRALPRERADKPGSSAAATAAALRAQEQEQLQQEFSFTSQVSLNPSLALNRRWACWHAPMPVRLVVHRCMLQYTCKCASWPAGDPLKRHGVACDS
jgi:hypothetical protein